MTLDLDPQLPRSSDETQVSPNLDCLGTTANAWQVRTETGFIDAWSWAVERARKHDAALEPRTRERMVRLETRRVRNAHDARSELLPAHVAKRSLTVASNAEEKRDAWQADLEYVWRKRVAPHIERLEARARRRRRQASRATGARRVRLLRSSEWAANRARSLAMSRADIVKSCRMRWRAVRCACGRREFPVGCDHPQLCAWCRKRHWRKWRHRITRSLDTHLRAARGAWSRHRTGLVPGIYLVTLTGPHSGDIETDRRAMGDAWRSLTKAAHAGRWWSAYALTWEVTKGESGTPHVHAHIACVSSWIPYDELHDAWRRAMPGALVLHVHPPKRGRNECGRAANYLAKYVTKGIDPSELSGQKAGELLCAFRGHRKVTTSRRFWHHHPPVCRCCRKRYVNDERPCSLQHVNPAGVLSSLAERYGVWLTRGDPQRGLDLDAR